MLKKILVVILSLLMFVGIFPETYNFVFFKLNQVYIAQTHCIQKDIKANTCQGKCYLKKLMLEDPNQDKPYAPKEKETKNVNQYCLEVEEVPFPQPLIITQSKALYFTTTMIDRLSVNKLLRPPDYTNS